MKTTKDNPSNEVASALSQYSSEVKYVGIRTESGCEVWVSRGDSVKRLAPRFDLRRHSPTGFEWGCGGSGPAHLALALLADWSGNSRFALKYYDEFKVKVVSSLPRRGWELTGTQIRELVNAIISPKRA